MNLLPQQNNRKLALTEKQEAFLDALFDNGGNIRAAAEVAGYAEGSIKWLKDRLADEIIDRTKTVLAGQSLKAANKLVSLVDAPDIGRQETMNHNVQAVHGVVLLPPKKEVVIDNEN